MPVFCPKTRAACFLNLTGVRGRILFVPGARGDPPWPAFQALHYSPVGPASLERSNSPLGSCCADGPQPPPQLPSLILIRRGLRGGGAVGDRATTGELMFDLAQLFVLNGVLSS